MARILIAEPHPDVALLLERVVRRLGHEPIRCNEARSEGLPDGDVLLLEPEGDGLALAQALRERRPRLPIVCTSSHWPTPAVLELGPVSYLVKPFSQRVLDDALRTAVAGAPTAGPTPPSPRAA